jgi:hypothetical protein
METVTKMRLSKETIAILKNFAAINSNILIKPGTKITTVSPHFNIYVEANIQEEFDAEVPIWDLNQFLGVISMFANPDLEFNDKYVDISNGMSSIRYHYSDASLLDVPKKEIKLPGEIFSFDLNESSLNEMIKAANILQVNDLEIRGENGKLGIFIHDNKNDTSNSFSILIDENYTGPDYLGKIKVSDLKLYPGSYKVYLTKTIISKFVHESGNLFYIIATERE